MISVCMTSDFFLEEADLWRPEAWDIMRQRSDVIFYLLTKRPQRVSQCLPGYYLLLSGNRNGIHQGRKEVYDPGQTGTDPTGVTVRHELPGQKNGF